MLRRCCHQAVTQWLGCAFLCGNAISFGLQIAISHLFSSLVGSRKEQVEPCLLKKQPAQLPINKSGTTTQLVQGPWPLAHRVHGTDAKSPII